MLKNARTARRLQFDDELAAALRPTSTLPLPSTRLFVTILGVVALAVLGVLGVSAARHIHLPSWSSGSKPVAALCTTIVDALRSGDLDTLAAVCIDGEAGRACLAKEKAADADTVQAATEDPASGDKAAAPLPSASLAFLKTLYEDLATQGLAWNQIQPLAFGGAQAKVVDLQGSTEPAVSVTGELFFSAGPADASSKVYSLEFTARACEDQFFVVNFWKCDPVSASPDAIDDFADARYREFKKEAPKEGERAEIKRPKKIFIPFE